MKDKYQIAVIGLGYVGLPLARLFATKHNVIGFDINEIRISEIMKGYDSTREVEPIKLKQVLKTKNQVISNNDIGLFCSSCIEDIKNCNIYIITVPTPITKNYQPDLKPLYKASETVGKVISKGNIVIYESTVFPGATEEECIPIIEIFSGLKYNIDFFAGYSPERINPGDKIHTVEKIKKITSGSTIETAQKVDALYKDIIEAGTHLAPSIRVAEAAKVIENTQRDINIAFVNELSLIFERLGLDTIDVLEASGTKWNFLPFRPGLVGGHCIGVDPYYLTYKAESVGYHPEVILSGRRINDSMGIIIANRVVKIMVKKGIPVKDSSVLVLGITFKENCPDIRNSRVIDVINELKSFGIKVDIYDPHANKKEVEEEYGISLIDIFKETYQTIVLAVAHELFRNWNFKDYKAKGSIIYDVKGALPREIIDERL